MTQSNKPALYDPSFEHDSCGFGLIASIRGEASAWIVDQAFAALCKMSHRGGVNADGVTGDGCGILFYRPDAWLRALARDAGIALPARFASGLVFLDADAIVANQAQETLERTLRAEGTQPLGWRDVPVADAPCGPLGMQSRPRIRQIFVAADPAGSDADFERALFRARRRAQHTRAPDRTF